MKTELEKILSVSGKSGIFKLIAGGKSSLVVESLVDGKRVAIPPTQRVSSLSDITMFTVEDDMPLQEILENAKNIYAGGPAPDHKSDSAVLRKAMKEILPSYDADRVYDSDIRKLLQWYNILQSKDMLDFASESDEDSAEEHSAE